MNNMKILIFLGALAIASSAPQKSPEQAIAIIKQEFEQEPDGSYKQSYETENGIKAEETGTLKKASSPDSSDVVVVEGSYAYTAPDGSVINLNYIADDEKGFQPQGAHIPTAPPIPPEIKKALEYLATLPPSVAGQN